MSKKKKAVPEQVYELKIVLKGTKPPIQRRIAVASDILLSDLHEVIQIVMGWDDDHLHQFVIRNSNPKPKPEQIRMLAAKMEFAKLAAMMRPDRCFSDPQSELEDVEDERKVRLNEIAPTVKSKIVYEYDFGDGWEHSIEVVKIGPPAQGVKYPMCISGKGACPPEDCGGVWGYYDMLEILKNPKHQRYEEIAEWMPPEFDPDYFNVEEVNEILASEF